VRGRWLLVAQRWVTQWLGPDRHGIRGRRDPATAPLRDRASGVTGLPGYEFALLHSNVRDGVAQRSVGDLQQARERTVEFQD
jgi:hypothetical protein